MSPRILSSFPVGSHADRVLRESLESLKRDAPPGDAELIDDILKGRASIKDLLDSRYFEERQENVLKDPDFLGKLGEQIAAVEKTRIDALSFLKIVPEDEGRSDG